VILRLDKVTKRYEAPERVEAVRQASLSIDRSDIVVLIGPSGAGKSTLLLLAAGLLEPDEGIVSGDGMNLAALSDRELADRLRDDVGISYQEPRLLDGLTVQDNVGLKLISGSTRWKDARQAALPWLARTGLEHRLGHLPHQLSGGERQRVGLARAMIGEPTLLLLDEPTAGLDTRRRDEVFALIAEASQRGTGVLLVTHDPAAAQIATRLVELRDGQTMRDAWEHAA
jgi:putative ABC transport system ATP-binding protein